MTNLHTEYPKRTFILLWILCLVGSWAIIPYIYQLGIIPASTSVMNLFLITTIQSSLLYGIICFVSYKILPKTDLHPFNTENLFKDIISPGVVFGGIVGSILLLFELTIFRDLTLSGAIHPPLWTGALASIYGAINEEVLLRLFLFTSIYYTLSKVFKRIGTNRLVILWSANVIVALMFGLGHLPTAFKLATPSGLEISRILILNGIAGVVFGWLYWSKGLWTAMVAHFIADLMIHVIFK